MHIISSLLYSIVAVYVMCFCCCWIAEVSVAETTAVEGFFSKKGPHLRVLSDFYLEYTVQSFYIVYLQ